MDATVVLRDVTESDLPLFFEYQRDPVAHHMAAFTTKDPEDRAAFSAHWQRLRRDDRIVARTVLFEGRVAVSILKFVDGGRPEVTYWIGREFWGRGIAGHALSQFLRHVEVRPLYGRAAKDNLASIRVLEKCGFIHCGDERGFANARGADIAEVLMVLGSKQGMPAT